MESPTRTRRIVLLFLCLLAFVLYLDRVCIAQAVEPIQKELSLSNSQMSYVLAAFTLAYGLFEVPAGRWGDIVGARRVLTRISIWWSVFTALTAVCVGFYSLVLVRFLFGAGEAGTFPNAARVIARWFPQSERGRVQGLLQATALVGATITPICAAKLISTIGWRPTFACFGMTGIVWAIVFYAWFRDDPAEHPAVNEAERMEIGVTGKAASHAVSIPWSAILNSRCVMLLATIMMCSSFNSYVYFSWFTKYLQAARGLNSNAAAWLTTLVMAGAATGTMSGGWVTDRMLRYARGSRWWRRPWGFFAFTMASVTLTIGISRESPYATATWAAFSILAAHLTISNWWSSAIELSGRHVGALFGLMNGMGVFGAMSSQFLFGYFSDWRKSQGFEGRDQWDPAFLIVAGVMMIAATCWLLVDSSRSIDPEAHEPTSAL